MNVNRYVIFNSPNNILHSLLTTDVTRVNALPSVFGVGISDSAVITMSFIPLAG